MPGESVFLGSLDFIGLADVFQILGGNSSTGVLRITSPVSPTPALIYFANGNPINAALGKTQGIKAIYPLFGWSAGRFEFRVEDIRVQRTIKLSPMQIVLDALRMLDDGLIKKMDPRGSEDAQEGEAGEEKTLRVVKGPLVDYTYVIGEEEFIDGQRIVREGGHGNWIWVILEGVVEVIKETPNDAIKIARLGEGCFIGGFAHLMHSGSKRSATVKAVGPVQLGVLDTERLSREFNSLSPEFKGILGSLDRRLRGVTDRLVDLVRGTYKPENPIKGKELNIDKLFERRELYKIKEGQAHVIARRRKDRVPLVTLDKDEYFGYTSFMSFGEDPGMTTIVTSKGIQVHHLDTEPLSREHDGLSGTFKGLIQSLETSVSLSIRTACEL